MKNFLIFIIALIFISGCNPSAITTIPMSGSVSFQQYDFRKYTDQGFLFTPYKFEGEYQSIAIIEMTLSPEIKRIDGGYKKNTLTKGDTLVISYKTDESSNDYEKHSKHDGTWFIEKINTEKALDEIYKRATGMGADAFVNFTMDVLYNNNGGLLYKTIRVHGYAIKRSID